MITLLQYWSGRDSDFANVLTEEIRANAIETVARANRLLELGGFSSYNTISSGWRPKALNAGVPGAGKRSHHIFGRAVDLLDRSRDLARYCVDNQDILVDLGLWMEHPDWTYSRYGNHWVHVQTVPPGSRRRIFIPNQNSSIAPADERFGDL